MSTFFDPRLPNPEWGPWFAIHPEQSFFPLTPVTAVSSVEGGISLFALGRDGVVMSTFFDPRVPDPQWGPWFPIHPESRFPLVDLAHNGTGRPILAAVSSVVGGSLSLRRTAAAPS